MTIHLVTFSDESMSRSRALCVSSALRHGVSQSFPWNEETLLLNGYKPEWLAQRGCGYWRFKPLIISKALEACEADGLLIYADAGIEFLNDVNHIISRMDQDIFLFGNQWEHAHWCKRDVIDAVWPWRMEDLSGQGRHATSTEAGWHRFGKQVQASVIFFKVTDYSKRFVKEWLKWCLFEGGRLIDDSLGRLPNHPEFRENRHDQAILTTLVYREAIRLHWWPASYNDGAFVYERGDYPDEGYPVMFNHHRRRDHEWKSAA